MSFDRRLVGHGGAHDDGSALAAGTPGKRTLTEQIVVPVEAGLSRQPTAPPPPSGPERNPVPAMGSVPRSGSQRATLATLFGRHAAQQAQADTIPTSEAPLIVSDRVAAGPGQLPKTEFLAQLRAEVVHTASDVLGPSWSVATCTDIPRIFARYASLEAGAIEQIVRRYARLPSAVRAADYIAAVCTRAAAAIARWGAGEELSWELGSSGLPLALQSRGAASGSAGIDPPIDLRAGAPIDSATAARLSDALGDSFADVRIHTEEAAANKTRALGADAMAVGNHIAFAPGEYQPGTPAGDGLISHELAHVVQQRGNAPVMQQRSIAVETSSVHEEDADRVADAVVARLHRGDPERTPIRPALATGLAVQRGNRPKGERKQKGKQAQKPDKEKTGGRKEKSRTRHKNQETDSGASEAWKEKEPDSDVKEAPKEDHQEIPHLDEKQRSTIEVHMGQGVSGNLRTYNLYSGSFASCVPIVMFNARTGRAGLFHLPQGQLGRHHEILLAMANDVDPTEIRIYKGSSYTPEGGTLADRQLNAKLEAEGEELHRFFTRALSARKSSEQVVVIDEKTSFGCLTLSVDPGGGLQLSRYSRKDRTQFDLKDQEAPPGARGFQREDWKLTKAVEM